MLSRFFQISKPSLNGNFLAAQQRLAYPQVLPLYNYSKTATNNGFSLYQNPKQCFSSKFQAVNDKTQYSSGYSHRKMR